MKKRGGNCTAVSACRGVRKISKCMPTMMGIDGGGKTSCLSEQAGDREIPIGIFHRAGEFGVRIAGRLQHVENHVGPHRLKAGNPGRIMQPVTHAFGRNVSCIRHRDIAGPGTIEGGPAVGKSATVNRQIIRTSVGILMKACQDECGYLRLAFKFKKIDNGCHVTDFRWMAGSPRVPRMLPGFQVHASVPRALSPCRDLRPK